MLTQWGENIDRDNVLQEYPRPQLQRDSYINLNGLWSYAMTDSDVRPDEFDGEILVPFSPECELSGVGRTLQPDQWLWYERKLDIPAEFIKSRVLLHFGAVDQTATVYVNGCEICTHIGGYTPFSCDITEHLAEENTLTVRVKDISDTGSYSRGKQKIKRGEIWYTVQSGIWQTVWLESVPECYVSGLRITPQYDASAVEIVVQSPQTAEGALTIDGRKYTFSTNESTVIPMDNFIAWSPENPHLYDFEVRLGEDSVKSYFGMRKFSVEKDENGIKRLFLNNSPYFHHGLLDQGYWSDGMYTAPSDDALIYDIQTAKDLGFTMLRKHIKIEPLRWYYHCDRLGMLVWQDMINGGGQYRFSTISVPLVTGVHLKDNKYKKFARTDKAGREQYYAELDEMLDTLYNVVSIAMWVPFNEGWGQFDAKEAVRRILAKDSTRTIDHASGWHDQYIGDIKSLHVYFKKYRFHRDKLARAVVLSEFGGYNLRVEGHCFNERDFGYSRLKDRAQFNNALRRLYEKEILPAYRKGLCATVFTQLTDVEDELNGLITYDRRVIKCDEQLMKDIAAKLR